MDFLKYLSGFFVSIVATETTFRHVHSASEEGVDGDNDDDDDDDDEMFAHDDIDLFHEKVRRGAAPLFFYFLSPV